MFEIHTEYYSEIYKRWLKSKYRISKKQYLKLVSLLVLKGVVCEIKQHSDKCYIRIVFADYDIYKYFVNTDFWSTL